ncbi:MAG: type II secretion system F family protein [Candidatus Aenigmatarchaeota archaeon]|nr:type II secretion system F family protein [Candidatus Aenigmarchaeota archaeon]
MGLKLEAIIPKSYLRWIKEKLEYLETEINEKNFVISQIYFSLILFSLIFFLSKNLFLAFFSFLIGFLTFVFLLYLSVENSKKKVEVNLPEFISLFSSNIKSGLTLEAAILASCRKEFGILDKIFRNIGKEIYSGKPIEEVLKKYSKKYKIETLQRFLYLLEEGIKKGSKISDLLFEISEDLRSRNVLKKELSSIISLYTMFIFFAVSFGMPILFGITTYFVYTIQTLAPKGFEAKIPINIPLSFKGIDIDVNFIRNFAILSILITSFFSSMIIGALKEGNEKIGIKYFPIILTISLLLYFAIQIVISQMMGFIIS